MYVSIWLPKIVSPAKTIWQLQMADYSKVKITFYWDCDACNPMRLTFYGLNFWITNLCFFVNPISFCECQNFLTGPKSFSLLNITFWTISKTFWYSLGFTKHWLGLQKFWTFWLYCLNGLKSLRKSHLHNHRPTFSQKSMRHTIFFNFDLFKSAWN